MQHAWSTSSKKGPRVLQPRREETIIKTIYKNRYKLYIKLYIKIGGLDQFQVLSEVKAKPDSAHRLHQYTHTHTLVRVLKALLENTVNVFFIGYIVDTQ